MEFSSGPAQESCATISSQENFGKKRREKSQVGAGTPPFCTCGKVVHGMCNTRWTFAHFSLALNRSIGDNPARS
jgi:hypothetical protein